MLESSASHNGVPDCCQDLDLSLERDLSRSGCQNGGEKVLEIAVSWVVWWRESL